MPDTRVAAEEREKKEYSSAQDSESQSRPKELSDDCRKGVEERS